MRFTAQEEYGLRCLLQIARAPDGTLTIPEIAARESLTQAYVAKLLRELRKGGFVQSARGQKGGYRLARPPEQMSLGSVLEAMGGRLYTDDFCERFAGNAHRCVHSVDCSIRSLWSALDQVLQRLLVVTTLRDLLCNEQSMESWLVARIDAPANPARSLASRAP